MTDLGLPPDYDDLLKPRELWRDGTGEWPSYARVAAESRGMRPIPLMSEDYPMSPGERMAASFMGLHGALRQEDELDYVNQLPLTTEQRREAFLTRMQFLEAIPEATRQEHLQRWRGIKFLNEYLSQGPESLIGQPDMTPESLKTIPGVTEQMAKDWLQYNETVSKHHLQSMLARPDAAEMLDDDWLFAATHEFTTRLADAAFVRPLYGAATLAGLVDDPQPWSIKHPGIWLAGKLGLAKGRIGDAIAEGDYSKAYRHYLELETRQKAEVTARLGRAGNILMHGAGMAGEVLGLFTPAGISGRIFSGAARGVEAALVRTVGRNITDPTSFQRWMMRATAGAGGWGTLSFLNDAVDEHGNLRTGWERAVHGLYEAPWWYGFELATLAGREAARAALHAGRIDPIKVTSWAIQNGLRFSPTSSPRDWLRYVTDMYARHAIGPPSFVRQHLSSAAKVLGEGMGFSALDVEWRKQVAAAIIDQDWDAGEKAIDQLLGTVLGLGMIRAGGAALVADHQRNTVRPADRIGSGFSMRDEPFFRERLLADSGWSRREDGSWRPDVDPDASYRPTRDEFGVLHIDIGARLAERLRMREGRYSGPAADHAVSRVEWDIYRDLIKSRRLLPGEEVSIDGTRALDSPDPEAAPLLLRYKWNTVYAKPFLSGEAWQPYRNWTPPGLAPPPVEQQNFAIALDQWIDQSARALPPELTETLGDAVELLFAKRPEDDAAVAHAMQLVQDGTFGSAMQAARADSKRMVEVLRQFAQVTAGLRNASTARDAMLGRHDQPALPQAGAPQPVPGAPGLPPAAQAEPQPGDVGRPGPAEAPGDLPAPAAGEGGPRQPAGQAGRGDQGELLGAQEVGPLRAEGEGEGVGAEPVGGVREEHRPEAPPSQEAQEEARLGIYAATVDIAQLRDLRDMAKDLGVEVPMRTKIGKLREAIREELERRGWEFGQAGANVPFADIALRGYDWWAQPLVDRFVDLAPPAAQEAAQQFRYIAYQTMRDARRLAGETQDMRVKLEKMASPVHEEWRAASRELRRDIPYPNAPEGEGYSFTVYHLALEGRYREENLSAEARRMLEGYRDYRYALGKQAEALGVKIRLASGEEVPFRASRDRNVMIRRFTPEMHDAFLKGPGNPTYDAFVRMTEVLNGLSREEAEARVNAYRDLPIYRYDATEHARHIPLMADQILVNGRWTKVLEADPFWAVRALGGHSARRFATIKNFGQHGQEHWIHELQRLGQDPALTEQVFRALNGIPLEAPIVQPGSPEHRWVARPFTMLMSLSSVARLGMAFVPNLVETIGAVGGYFGAKDTVREMAWLLFHPRELKKRYLKLAEMGAITRDVFHWGIERGRTWESIAANARNVLYAHNHWVQEWNDMVAASVALTMVERMARGKGKPVEEATLRQWGFKPEDIALMMRGIGPASAAEREQLATLYGDVVRVSAGYTAGSLLEPGERSRAMHSRPFRYNFRWQTYFTNTGGRMRQMITDLIESYRRWQAGEAPRSEFAGAAHLFARFLGMRAVGGVGMRLIRAWVLYGLAGLVAEALDAENPVDFVGSSLAFALLGGAFGTAVTALWAGKNIFEQLADATITGSALMEAKDALLGDGSYEGLGVVERIGHGVRRQAALGPVVLYALGIEDREMALARKEFYGWLRDRNLMARVEKEYTADQVTFRTAMKEAARLLANGADPDNEKVTAALRRATGTKERRGRGIDAVRASLRGRKMLESPGYFWSKMDEAQRAELLEHLDSRGVLEKIRSFDALLEQAARDFRG